MADNFVGNAGSGGSTFAGALASFSGDNAIFCGIFQGIAAGSEGSWTVTPIVGGAGAVGAGVQRMTLASDDPAVALLGSIDADTSSLVGCVGGTELQVDIVGSLPAGTNAIGKLAANSGVDIGDVDITSIAAGDNNIGNVDIASAIPAGTNTIGGTISQASSSVVYDGTTACTVKRFHVVVDADGETVIAAPTGTKKIRVLSIAIFALDATAVSFHLESGTSNNDCFGTGDDPLTVDLDGGGGPAGIVLPWNPGGWFQVADADEALEIQFSADGVDLLIVGNYIEVA